MRPMRRMGGGGGGFGVFGLETVAAKLTVALAAMSILYLVTRDALGGLLLLWPMAGLELGNFRPWQVLTYAFISPISGSPIWFIFALMMTYQMGGFLEATWGHRRTLMLALGAPVLAGVVTALLGLAGVLSPMQPYPGAWVLTSVLWVAYGWIIGRGQTAFWFIQVTGNTLALIGIGFLVLQALTSGWRAVVPEAIAVACTFAFVHGASPRALWARLQHGRMRRNMRKNHLKVVDRRDRDSYLN